jgi:hypothetical protein
MLLAALPFLPTTSSNFVVHDRPNDIYIYPNDANDDEIDYTLDQVQSRLPATTAAVRPGHSVRSRDRWGDFELCGFAYV